MKPWKPIAAAALIATGVALTACSESPEVRMQRAKVALTNDKFPQALDLAQALINEQPNNLDAMDVKARAQLRLQRLEDAKATIDTMLEKDAKRLETHKLVADWTFFRMSSLLAQSSFTTDPTMQTQFDQAIELGNKQAEWFEQNEQKADNAKYLRARYAESEARRQQVAMRAATGLSKVNSEGGDAIKQTQEITARYQQLIDQKLSDAESHLRDVLEINPRHFDAVVMYARLLTQRSSWDSLWGLAQKVSKEKDIPVSVYDVLVVALLRMPADTQAPAERVKAGWALQAAVTQAGKENFNYKKATAKLHMLANEPAKAQPLLEQIVKVESKDPEHRYLLASSYAAQEKYGDAIKVLEKLSVEYQRNSQIQFLFARVLYAERKLDPAKEALRKAIEADPENPEPRAMMAKILFETGQGKSAGADIDQAYRARPDDPQAISMKLQLERAYGTPETVREVLDRTEKISPMLEAHLVLLVDGYMGLKNGAKAETYAAKLAKERPDSLDAQLKLAETQLSQNKDEQVVELLGQLKKKFANSPGVDQMLGRLYLQRDKLDRAVDVMTKVVAAEPRNVEARFMLARAYGGLAMTDEALDQLSKLFELQPDHVAAHGLAARIHQLTGQSEKAADHLSKIDESKLDERGNAVLLAQIKLQKHDDDAAIAICNRAIASGNQDALLRIILAGLYQRKNDKGLAEQNLIGLVRSQPDNKFAFALLTRFYSENRLFTQGLSELSKLQTINEPCSVLGQAQLLIGMGKPVEALAKLKPTFDSLLTRKDKRALMMADPMALIYVAGGKPDEANKVYESLKPLGYAGSEISLRQIDVYTGREPVETTVKKLDDLATRAGATQVPLRRQILNRYRKLGALSNGLKFIDSWMESQKDDATLYQWKGEFLFFAGRAADSAASYRQAIKLSSDDTAIYPRLAQALMANADYPGAEAAFDDMAKIDSGAKVISLTLKGEMFLSIGLNRPAADTFEQLERLGRPSDPRVMLAMGQAFWALGKNDKAVQRLSDVPNFAPQYAPAQILLARIEQATGKPDKAKPRIEALIADPRTNAVAIAEMSQFQLKNAREGELLRWVDQQLAVDRLPLAQRDAWLRIRVGIEAVKQNWEGVLASLNQLAKIESDQVKAATSPQQAEMYSQRLAQVQVSQALVLIRLRKGDQAQLSAKDSSRFATGWLVALALGQKVDAPGNRTPLIDLTAAMIRGDVPAAKEACAKLPPLRTIYASDLAALLNRSDASSPEMQAAFRQFALALAAQEVNLPQLGEEISQDLTTRMPEFMPAYGIQTQALLAQNKSIEGLLSKIRKTAPGTTMAKFLQSVQLAQDTKYEEACKVLEDLLAKDPQNYHFLFDYCTALQGAKQYPAAIKQLRNLYGINSPYKWYAANDLAYLMSEHEPASIDEAEKIANESLSHAAQLPQVWDTVGWISHLKGNNQKALSQLLVGLPMLRTIPALHYHTGMTYKSLGNKTWAGYHFEQASQGSSTDPYVTKAKKVMSE